MKPSPPPPPSPPTTLQPILQTSTTANLESNSDWDTEVNSVTADGQELEVLENCQCIATVYLRSTKLTNTVEELSQQMASPLEQVWPGVSVMRVNFSNSQFLEDELLLLS